MPTYDYRCRNCLTLFEARHPVSARNPECPACGAQPKRVILSAPAIHAHMARGREAAARTFEKQEIPAGHAPGCHCCH